MGDNSWAELLSYHWRKILGGLIGFLVALIFVIFGFGWGLFIILCVSLGVFIGWHLDAGNGMQGILDFFRYPRR